jgi:hypothetical protein
LFFFHKDDPILKAAIGKNSQKLKYDLKQIEESPELNSFK